MFKTVLLFILLSSKFIVFPQEISNKLFFSTTSMVSNKNSISILLDSSKLDSDLIKSYSIENIFGQALVGSLCAATFAAFPFSATSSKLGSRDQLNSASAILTIAWYTFGAAVGVHWIAKSENPELSFWGTFGSSVIGACLGTGFIYLLSDGIKSPPHFSVVIAAVSPIISSMIYASFISDWPNENRDLSLQKDILAHKDLINHSKIFDLELLRINF